MKPYTSKFQRSREASLLDESNFVWLLAELHRRFPAQKSDEEEQKGWWRRREPNPFYGYTDLISTNDAEVERFLRKLEDGHPVLDEDDYSTRCRQAFWKGLQGDAVRHSPWGPDLCANVVDEWCRTHHEQRYAELEGEIDAPGGGGSVPEEWIIAALKAAGMYDDG